MRRISEREADIAMLVLILLACVGIFTLAKWAVAFWMSIIVGLMFA